MASLQARTATVPDEARKWRPAAAGAFLQRAWRWQARVGRGCEVSGPTEPWHGAWRDSTWQRGSAAPFWLCFLEMRAGSDVRNEGWSRVLAWAAAAGPGLILFPLKSTGGLPAPSAAPGARPAAKKGKQPVRCSLWPAQGESSTDRWKEMMVLKQVAPLVPTRTCFVGDGSLVLALFLQTCRRAAGLWCWRCGAWRTARGDAWLLASLWWEPTTGFSSTWECCDLALKKGGNTILMTQIFQSFSCLFFLLLQLVLFPTTNFLSPKEFSR